MSETKTGTPNKAPRWAWKLLVVIVLFVAIGGGIFEILKWYAEKEKREEEERIRKAAIEAQIPKTEVPMKMIRESAERMIHVTLNQDQWSDPPVYLPADAKFEFFGPKAEFRREADGFLGDTYTWYPDDPRFQGGLRFKGPDGQRLRIKVITYNLVPTKEKPAMTPSTKAPASSSDASIKRIPTKDKIILSYKKGVEVSIDSKYPVPQWVRWVIEDSSGKKHTENWPQGARTGSKINDEPNKISLYLEYKLETPEAPFEMDFREFEKKITPMKDVT